MVDREREPMMQIGKFAQRTGLSIHTIRHYDDVALLRPSGRSEGGFRLYTEADLERVNVIRRIKPLGFSLEQMREVLDVLDTLPAAGPAELVELGKRLEAIKETACERRATLLEQVALADNFIGLLEHLRPSPQET
ncbi:MerR family transcriptional regulator [Georgenia daeguensis]|uniref:MerR family transcriptional regulator n=1 Tax=Georgenia daeguensis TaxID=908355 RepID=A0ABP8EYK4_9MICO